MNHILRFTKPHEYNLSVWSVLRIVISYVLILKVNPLISRTFPSHVQNLGWLTSLVYHLVIEVEYLFLLLLDPQSLVKLSLPSGIIKVKIIHLCVNYIFLFIDI